MRRPRVLQDFRDILGRGMPRPYRVGNSCAMPDSVVCCEEIDGTPIEGNYVERVIFDSRGTGRGKKGESACKPGSVEDNHSSAARVTTDL